MPRLAFLKARCFLSSPCVFGSPVEMLRAWAARSLAGICILVYTLALTSDQERERAVGWVDEGADVLLLAGTGALSKELALASLIC